MWMDEETERLNRIMDIPLTDYLKKNNPALYEEILRLKYGDD